MALMPSEVYLDRVQQAVELHPDWLVHEILEYVFNHWTKRNAYEFIGDCKDNLRKSEEAPPRAAWENRNA